MGRLVGLGPFTKMHSKNLHLAFLSFLDAELMPTKGKHCDFI
jgi:hypothetical protein